MTATSIVDALLNSDEEFMSELAAVAAGTVPHVMGALQSPKAAEVKFTGKEKYQFDLNISISEQSTYSKNRMISIKWTHHDARLQPHLWRTGGGYFFLPVDKFPEFERHLAVMVDIAKKGSAAEASMKDAWQKMLGCAYVKPHKRYARRNYTTDGWYAYFS